MKESDKIIQEFTSQEYKEGFVTDVQQVFIPKGLNEDIIRRISALKEEPRNRNGCWISAWTLSANGREWSSLRGGT